DAEIGQGGESNSGRPGFAAVYDGPFLSPVKCDGFAGDDTLFVANDGRCGENDLPLDRPNFGSSGYGLPSLLTDANIPRRQDQANASRGDQFTGVAGIGGRSRLRFRLLPQGKN